MHDPAQDLESELKVFIVAVLGLESPSPRDLTSDTPLFDDGLGLDSIDALQLASAIQQRFRVALPADEGQARQVLASVRTLAGFIGPRLLQGDCGKGVGA